MTPCSCRNSARPSTRSQLGDVGERHPRRLGRVVAGHRLGVGSSTVTRKSRITKWWSSPMRSTQPDELAARPPRGRSPRRARARRPRPASRRARPDRRAPTTPRAGPVAAADQQQAARRRRRRRRRRSRGGPSSDRPCEQRSASGGAAARGLRGRGTLSSSRRWTMIARATMPAASKKFLVSRFPGSTIESIPKHPASIAHASTPSSRSSPTPTSRPPGST